ncbi:putative type I restriction enzymeP M protein [Acaryochloris thomasi RCC1774]|uniref:site-specific DNA-methyltransferase (adenine-specific) n=1 Tax=Acaryochloris thomasi RCC1774 TaxID=1764569 RepID=A0A2W1JZ27_9CYAN|nr:class I SAM-dependent DNA methyltransferase [Acaryochloris thomasi]PZD73741.1 putative type I restriction enzymeP M protein [Acaryochloris thomasi RCC1774]
MGGLLQVTASDINRALWRACDVFRGELDPSKYRNYVQVMFFWKYVSDVWRDRCAQYQKELGDNPDQIRCEMSHEWLVLPEGSSFYDIYEQRDEPCLGNLIHAALRTLEETLAPSIHLQHIDFDSQANLGQSQNQKLRELLEVFSRPELDLRPSRVGSDIVGSCYVTLLERFAAEAGKGIGGGEFLTPVQVSKLVARLAQPKEGDLIYDPACGSGTLLIQVAKEVEGTHYSLYGQEKNFSAWTLAQMNMFLNNEHRARMEWGDTLSYPKFFQSESSQSAPLPKALMRFDVVVANPPFSLSHWGADNARHDPYDRFLRGVPPKTKGDYAFISHMIESALPCEGRVVVVVPHGVLFRASSEGKIRRKLIDENLLDAVIGLPPNLLPSTTIPVAILVFDRSREKGGTNDNYQDVIFIDASRDFQVGKTKNSLLDEHIEKIIQTYKSRETVDRYASVATLEEIEDNDFNLNIPRYVDTFEMPEEVDIDEVKSEIKKLEAELTEVRVKIAGYLKELGV